VTYLLKDRRDEAMARLLNLLADFAFYSGVGYKTTMGMGMVKRTGEGQSRQTGSQPNGR
jgi:CRISPR/Cas system endoribonuclease Cas6 (RAMP superfamily)